MAFEVDPNNHDLIKLLREKFGVDPEFVIVKTNDGMISRERNALMFDIDLTEEDAEKLGGYLLSSDHFEVDSVVKQALDCLIKIGVMNENRESICGIQPLVYCQNEYGVHSIPWYCAKIVDVSYNHDSYLRKAEDGEIPMGTATWYATQLGAWCVEFVLKFQHEENAMRGVKTMNACKLAAEATAKIARKRTQPRLEEMKRLVPTLGVSGAASHLAAKGMGTFSANRGLWYRQLK